MATIKLETNSIYKIIELKEIETKFGTCYIMKDTELNEYWSNKKIASFIKQNKIPMTNNGKVLFKIKTGDYKTFTNESGDEIKFLNLNIFK